MIVFLLRRIKEKRQKQKMLVGSEIQTKLIDELPISKPYDLTRTSPKKVKEHTPPTILKYFAPFANSILARSCIKHSHACIMPV